RAVEALHGDAEDEPREAPVEHAERFVGATSDLAHQLLVAGGVVRRCHPAGSVRATVHCCNRFHQYTGDGILDWRPAPVRSGGWGRQGTLAGGAGTGTVESRPRAPV